MVSAAAPACPLPYGQSPRRRPLLGTLQRLVNSFKFGDRHDIRRLFGNWLHQAGQELIAEADLLVLVALTGMRLLHRRFDQAAIIAQEISRRSDLPVRTKVLTRTRRTKRQAGLTAEQRHMNVRGSFRVPTRELPCIRDCRVLLIDDVITTGAPAEACTKAPQ